MLKNSLLSLFGAIALFLLTACGEDIKPSNEALVIILGRHANALEFNEDQYNEVERRLNDYKIAYGGYVRIIIGDGKPTLVPVSIDTYLEKAKDKDGKELESVKVELMGKTGKGDKEKVVAKRTIPTPEGYYFPDAHANFERKFIVSQNAKEIMNFIKDRQNVATHATHPENDLFEAIYQAKIVIDNIYKDARRKNLLNISEKERNTKPSLKSARIIIMDTGIVTTGEMDFSKFGVESVDFRSSSAVENFANTLVNHLKTNSVKLNLENIRRIDFIGLGDAASPQSELTRQQKDGLETIWGTVLKAFGASKVEFHPRKNLTLPEPVSDLPPVSIIEFGGAPEPPVLDVLFEFAKDTYVDREKTKTALGGYANSFKRRLSADPSLKLYIVGAECRIGYRSRDLSNRRAYAVKNSLAALGVSPDRMVAFGVGIDDPWRSYEGPDANGNYNEKIAEKNRKVMFFYSSNAEFVKKAEEARNKK